jgi:hypothetical protein
MACKECTAAARSAHDGKATEPDNIGKRNQPNA